MINYKLNEKVPLEQVLYLFKHTDYIKSVDEPTRIDKMNNRWDLLVSAWNGEQLVGYARALTDFAYICYLADLVVLSAYKRTGIGRTLIDKVRTEIGDEANLVLLSSPEAMDYYPKVGFTKAENAYLIQRKK